MNTERKSAVDVAKALFVQNLFHELTYSLKEFKDDKNVLYQLTQTANISKSQFVRKPTGVIVALIGCYSPTCSGQKNRML